MEWSLLELRKHQETPLTFHETLDLKTALTKRDSLILDVAPVEVESLVLADKKGYIARYTVQTTLTIPSTRSLELVELPMDLSVDEVFMTERQFQSRGERMSADEILLIGGPLLNLVEPIKDNILLAVPVRALTKEEEVAVELPRGNGWEVVSEEGCRRRRTEEAENRINPRLIKLFELFDSEPRDDDNK